MNTKEILATYKTIAVVGLSDKPNRPSYGVSAYMMQAGYDIIPINPMAISVFGKKAYPSLLALSDELKKKIEIVNIFRKPSDVPPIVDEAIAIGAKAVWLQLGITNDDAADKAKAAGLAVVQNRCIKVEHELLF